jgi:hypothetical protein
VCARRIKQVHPTPLATPIRRVLYTALPTRRSAPLAARVPCSRIRAGACTRDNARCERRHSVPARPPLADDVCVHADRLLWGECWVRKVGRVNAGRQVGRCLERGSCWDMHPCEGRVEQSHDDVGSVTKSVQSRVCVCITQQRQRLNNAMCYIIRPALVRGARIHISSRMIRDPAHQVDVR